MRGYLLLGICILLTGSEGLPSGENVVKQGTFPFMALVYYIDDTILENGRRFMRNAILIRPQWLVSSTIEVQGNATFPYQTLLARAGAVALDANMTLNEEVFEQEQEIIQVVQPADVDLTEWWHYNISLLKTLQPFKVTPQVAPTDLSTAYDFTEKTCYIVLYGNSNSSDQRILMQLPVQIQSPESCGVYFKKDTMICSANDDHNIFSYDSDSCERNSGGPLICEDTVAGLQTYVNGCKEPHLYLLLAKWSNFISCGVEENCRSDSCNHICYAVDKDEPVTTFITTSITTITLENQPERRTLATQSEISQVANEVKEITSSIIIEEIKPTTKPESTMDDADTTTTSTEMTIPVSTTTTESTTTTTTESTTTTTTESTTTTTTESTSTTTTDSTMAIEAETSTELISERLPVMFDHKLATREPENNLTVVAPKPQGKLRSRKSEASTNSLMVTNCLLIFILPIFV